MKKGVFAGCFDPFPHPGHVWTIEQALDVCDEIIILLHKEPNLERSHKSKTVLTVEERIILMRNIKGVADVIPYETEEDLKSILISSGADVRILGDDYIDKPFTGDDLGMEVFYAKRLSNWSATNFRKKVLDFYQKEKL